MPFCTRCDTRVSEILFNCPNCGERLHRPINPPTFLKKESLGGPVPEDRDALSSIQKYSIIGLINIAVGLGVYIYFIVQSLLLLDVFSSPTPQFPFNPLIQNLFLEVDALFMGEAIATLLSLYFLWKGFGSLAKVSDEFGTPSKLTFVSLVSAPTLFMITMLLFELILSTALHTTPPFSAQVTYALIVVLFLASIAAIIGGIGGIALGLWRVGSRYDDGLFRASAICTIIPFLAFIAPILELIAIHQIRKGWSGGQVR